MKLVYVLQHEYEKCGVDEVKFIGVYRTPADAQNAIERLRSRPGFCNYPDGFTIGSYTLDQDHWTEGFISSEEALETK